MKRLFGLSKLKFKKAKELIRAKFGKYSTISKGGEIRYGETLLRYFIKPKRTTFLEFCINDLPLIYKISVKSYYTAEEIIDIAYSKFILGEYNMSDLGAGHKFYTIRNAFRSGFRLRDYLVNHYSNKLAIPIIELLKKEFSDRDILNIIMPKHVSILAVVKEFESGIIDHVRKEFNLMRAGPDRIRSPLRLVA